jgi:predicted ATP-grasp superfamily ATP-dependent carboligase
VIPQSNLRQNDETMPAFWKRSAQLILSDPQFVTSDCDSMKEELMKPVMKKKVRKGSSVQ